jgi:hypothetical protein
MKYKQLMATKKTMASTSGTNCFTLFIDFMRNEGLHRRRKKLKGCRPEVGVQPFLV